MSQIKLRIIKSSTDTQSTVFGVTIPSELVLFYSGTYFTPIKVDNGILLISGTKNDIQKLQFQNIDLEYFRV